MIDIVPESPEQTTYIKYRTKKLVIKDKLNQIKKKYVKFYTKYKKYKKSNTTINIITNFLHATTVATTTIGLTFFPPSLFISLGISSVNGIISGTTMVLNLRQKLNTSYTVYLQLLDMYNDYSNKLLINNLSSIDMDTMLSNLNSKLGLILDSACDIDVSLSSN